MKRILFFCAAMLAVLTCNAQRIQVIKNGDVLYECSESEGVEVVFKKIEIYNGHEYVDLGLPSGLKWATVNVGATKPEEYGDYFAWGEIQPKSEYKWSTYKWCKGSENTQTKYCQSPSYGNADYKTVLDPEDDAAHVIWGGDWRMPTKAEVDELVNNCTCTWKSQNGVNGCKVTGPNGNYIFLPAAGYYDDNGLQKAGNHGTNWSSTLYSYSSEQAYYFRFDGFDTFWNYYNRSYGRPVRPVCP